eukprot:gene27673-16936_t
MGTQPTKIAMAKNCTTGTVIVQAWDPNKHKGKQLELQAGQEVHGCKLGNFPWARSAKELMRARVMIEIPKGSKQMWNAKVCIGSEKIGRLFLFPDCARHDEQGPVPAPFHPSAPPLPADGGNVDTLVEPVRAGGVDALDNLVEERPHIPSANALGTPSAESSFVGGTETDTAAVEDCVTKDHVTVHVRDGTPVACLVFLVDAAIEKDAAKQIATRYRRYTHTSEKVWVMTPDEFKEELQDLVIWD